MTYDQFTVLKKNGSGGCVVPVLLLTASMEDRSFLLDDSTANGCAPLLALEWGTNQFHSMLSWKVMDCFLSMLPCLVVVSGIIFQAVSDGVY